MRTPVSRFERIAGYFILLSLVALAALFIVPAMKTGGLLSRRTYALHIHTDDGIDLESGDKVTMKGIQVGEVENLDFITEVKDGKEQVRVRVTCSIYWEYREKITRHSKFYMVPAAVVGRGKIEIHPGVGNSPLQDRIVEGKKKVSITDRVNDLLLEVDDLLEVANKRISDLEATLVAVQKILDHISEGEGSLGKFLYEDELHNQIVKVLGHMEETVAGVDRITQPLAGFSETLPDLTMKIRDVTGKLDDILENLRKGMGHFPAVVSGTLIALTEGRKILESLKRNFFIRGNLPANREPEEMAPASRRSGMNLN